MRERQLINLNDIQSVDELAAVSTDTQCADGSWPTVGLWIAPTRFATLTIAITTMHASTRKKRSTADQEAVQSPGPNYPDQPCPWRRSQPARYVHACSQCPSHAPELAMKTGLRARLRTLQSAARRPADFCAAGVCTVSGFQPAIKFVINPDSCFSIGSRRSRIM